MSFRLKIILGVVAIEAVMLALLIAMGLQYLRRAGEDEFAKRAATTAELFAAMTKNAVLATDLASLESFVDEVLTGGRDMVYARVVDMAGVTLAEGGDTPPAARPFVPDRHWEDVDDGVFDVKAPIMESGIPYGRVEVGFDVDSLRALQRGARSRGTILAGLALAFTAMFAWLLGYFLTRRLDLLAEGSERLASGELGFQLPVLGGDELARTALTFNRMSTELQKTYANLEETLQEATRYSRELRQSQEKYANLFHRSNVGIFIHDQDWTLLDVNDKALEMFGYNREEAVGANLSRFIPAAEVSFAKARYHELMREGYSHFRMDLLRRDGAVFPADVSVNVFTIGDRKVVQGMARDVTDAVRAENAVRETAARLRAVFDSVVDAVITIDEQGVVESFNPAAERIFGYSASEVRGRNVIMLMPEPYRSEHRRYLDRYLTTGEARIIGIGREVAGRRKSGEVFPAELAVSEVLLGDRRIFTGVLRDITERKKIDRMKREFVSTVNHELRTPLTSIHGSLGLLLGGAGGELPSQAAALVDIAQRNSQRLVALINDILDMEKMEAGRLELHLGHVDLATLTGQAVEANQGYAAQYGVTLLAHEAEPGLVVSADRDRMMQVLGNLLSNAVKFSPEGGVVELAVERLGQSARVSVQDHGPGIPEAFQPRIFQKFSQADASDARRKGGTGLGLSIAKSLVEQHGGLIGFRTAEGQGTTFFFSLPLADPHQAEPEES